MTIASIGKVPKEWRPFVELIRDDFLCDYGARNFMAKQPPRVRCAVIAAFVVAQQWMRIVEIQDFSPCVAHDLSIQWDLTDYWSTQCRNCVCVRVTKMACSKLKSTQRTNLQAAKVLYAEAFARLTKAEKEWLTSL